METTDATPLTDTQSQPDDRQIAIDRVGIRALRYPMQVRDKARTVQHTIATAALTVDLPHHFKGTHMSRFVEVLAEFGPELHVDNIRAIKLYERHGFVREGRYQIDSFRDGAYVDVFVMGRINK